MSKREPSQLSTHKNKTKVFLWSYKMWLYEQLFMINQHKSKTTFKRDKQIAIYIWAWPRSDVTKADREKNWYGIWKGST